MKSTGIADIANFGPEAEFFIFDDVVDMMSDKMVVCYSYVFGDENCVKLVE